MSEDHDSLLSFPIELQPTKEELDALDVLFQGRKIRSCYHGASVENGEVVIPVLKIIIDERLSIWFMKENGEWFYDGWEAGNYTKDWLSQVLG